MSTNGTDLSNDQKVVHLVNGYLNTSHVVNSTFQNGSLSSQYGYFGGASASSDWLTTALLYEEQNPTSNFCESGSCVADCKDLNSLFNGTSPAPFSVCILFANVSRTLSNRAIWTQEDALQLTSFGFSEKPIALFELIANATTTCLINACTQNPNAKHCGGSCSPQGLLVNTSTPSFGGVTDCLQQVCSQDVSFADFDLAGIGVSTLWHPPGSTRMIADVSCLI